MPAPSGAAASWSTDEVVQWIFWTEMKDSGQIAETLMMEDVDGATLLAFRDSAHVGGALRISPAKAKRIWKSIRSLDPHLPESEPESEFELQPQPNDMAAVEIRRNMDASTSTGTSTRSGPLRLYTDALVRRPLLFLMIFLGPLITLAVFGLLKPISFDIGLDAFNVQRTHFSQQRQNALENAIKVEKANMGYDNAGPDFWSNKRRRLQQGTLDSLADLTQQQLKDRESADVIGRLELIFLRRDGGNVITPEYIEKIHKIENEIQQFPGFAYYCILDQRVYGLRHCAPPNSAISYFYPSVGEQQLIYDGHGTSIVDFAGTVAALKKFATVGVTTSTQSIEAH
jgi:hypothetical protein